MGMNTNKKRGAISEINVVPFIDIMLVLLVIFMITAPLMFNGIDLKLPKTKKVNQVKLTKKQIVVSVLKTGDVFIGEDKFLLSELTREIQARMEVKDQAVFIRADYAIRYGKVAKLISRLKRAGISNISLVTEVEK